MHGYLGTSQYPCPSLSGLSALHRFLAGSGLLNMPAGLPSKVTAMCGISVKPVSTFPDASDGIEDIYSHIPAQGYVIQTANGSQ